MQNPGGWLAATTSVALIAGVALNAGEANTADACTPGKTKKIAFMLKQPTAFRYLNADVPFFKKTAEAAGYEVIVQSAENNAQKQIAQAENVITRGVDAIDIQRSALAHTMRGNRTTTMLAVASPQLRDDSIHNWGLRMIPAKLLATAGAVGRREEAPCWLGNSSE
jgi:ABC-type xylose transport system substrate-binding protein